MMKKKLFFFIIIFLVGRLFLFSSSSFGAEKRCCPENYHYDALEKDCFYFKDGNINEDDRKSSYCPGECNVRTQLCGWKPPTPIPTPPRKSCTPGKPETCGLGEVCNWQTKTCFKREERDKMPKEYTSPPCHGRSCDAPGGCLPFCPDSYPAPGGKCVCVDPLSSVDPLAGWKGGKPPPDLPPPDLPGFVADILTFSLGIGGGIAFLLMLWGGLTIILSAGNPEKVKAGKEIITSAIAGLLLIIFSVFILRLIGYDILRIPGFAP